MTLTRSLSLLASGAFVTAGLVWLKRVMTKKPAEREEWDSPSLEPKTEPLPKTALGFPDDLEDELGAAEDARRDIGADPLDLDTMAEPEDVDSTENPETVHAHERAVLPEEAYDAVDADDLGTEWLYRATGAPPRERPPTPEELVERAALEAQREKL